MIGIYKQFLNGIMSWRYTFVKHGREPVWEFAFILTVNPAQAFDHHLTDDIDCPRLFPIELYFEGWKTDTGAARRG